MADENTGSGATPTNVSDDQQFNPFDDESNSDGDAGATSIYKPEEGLYGPKPYGDFTPPEYENGDPQGIKRAQQYPQQHYNQEGDQVVDPLDEVAPYMSDQELAFVQSLNPAQQGYFLSATSRIRDVYEAQAEKVAQYETELQQTAEDLAPLIEMHDSLIPAVQATGQFDSMENYFESLVAADMAMTEDPREAILEIMAHYGMKISDLMAGAMEYTEKINNPYYTKAQQLERQQQEYESYIQDLQEKQEQEENARLYDSAEQQIAAFAQEADEYGLLHPYFDIVEDKMNELLLQSGDFNLDKLYEEACWLVPEVREDMLANGYGQPEQYYQPQPQQAPQQNFQKFATNNAGGDASVYTPTGNDDGFKEIFERNYKRFVGGGQY
jgi:hypothetical protein